MYLPHVRSKISCSMFRPGARAYYEVGSVYWYRWSFSKIGERRIVRFRGWKEGGIDWDDLCVCVCVEVRGDVCTDARVVNMCWGNMLSWDVWKGGMGKNVI